MAPELASVPISTPRSRPRAATAMQPATTPPAISSRRPSQVMSPPALPLAPVAYTGSSGPGGNDHGSVRSASGPLRHPKPLTPSDIHSMLEQEQEAMRVVSAPTTDSFCRIDNILYIYHPQRAVRYPAGFLLIFLSAFHCITAPPFLVKPELLVHPSRPGLKNRKRCWDHSLARCSFNVFPSGSESRAVLYLSATVRRNAATISCISTAATK
ncbi:hypothetical protein AFLA70_46g003361 [Aspergillus flavus AF70]|nr:hypothetical protein AFLA70_46g003361 [Aspergillus flavus AF70]